MTPAWELPHEFALIDVAGSRPTSPPIEAVTFGPIAADLMALAQPTSEVITRLGRSLGFEWITSLAWSESETQRDEPALTVYLREQHRLRPGAGANPFAARRGKLVLRRHKALPAELIDEFVTTRRGQLRHIGTAIAPVLRPLLDVAAGANWPERDGRGWAAKSLNALQPAFRFRKMTNLATSRSFYAIESPDLYTRALREIIDLFDQRPLLRICGRCERLYVPRTAAQKHCQRFTWNARTGELLATCTPDITTDVTARRDRDARRLEYKRLQMRARRFKERYGASDPRASMARSEFETWKDANPATRGRPMNPISIDYVPERRR